MKITKDKVSHCAETIRSIHETNDIVGCQVLIEVRQCLVPIDGWDLILVKGNLEDEIHDKTWDAVTTPVHQAMVPMFKDRIFTDNTSSLLLR